MRTSITTDAMSPRAQGDAPRAVRRITSHALVCLTAITSLHFPAVAQVFPVDGRVATGECDGCIGFPSASPIITAVRDVLIHDCRPSVSRPGELYDGVLLWVDRPYTAGDVPSQLEGADYVQLAQNLADYVVTNGFYPRMQIDVEVDVIEGAVLYLLVDTSEQYRKGGHLPFEWMTHPETWGGLAWMDTRNAMDQGARPYYIYRIGPLPQGTYHFREQEVDSGMYVIAALWAPLPPRLAIARESEGRLILTWQNPSDAPAYILQQCSNLSAPNWGDVAVATPGRHEIPAPNDTRFFRLANR